MDIINIPSPVAMAINAHLYILFAPDWVKAYPDAWIEIATASPARGRAIDRSRTFPVFDLKDASDHAIAMNRRGLNVYVGPALRTGNPGQAGRGADVNYLASRFAWVDADKDYDGLCARLTEHGLAPFLAVRTGSTPTPRVQLYFLLDQHLDGPALRAANVALQEALGTDAVANPSRLLRLNGTVSYPPPDKVARGYVPEVVVCDAFLHNPRGAAPLDLGRLLESPSSPEAHAFTPSDPYDAIAATATSRKGRSDDALYGLLEASRTKGQWHNSIRDAIATMVGRGWEEAAIRLACAPYCRDGAGDKDLAPLIDGAFAKFGTVKEEARAQEKADPPADPGPSVKPPPSGGDDDYVLHYYDPVATVLRLWLVDKFLPQTGVGLLSGQWGTGKSFIALDLSASVMTGIPFIGQDIPRRGGVLYVAAEAASEMPARLKALIEHKLKPIAASGPSGEAMLQGIGGNLDDPPFAWLEDVPRLKSPKDIKKLVKAAKEFSEILKAKYNLSLALIIIDTLGVTADWIDENSSAEGQQVMGEMAGVSRETGAFVLALDHFGKAVETGTRGTSAKESAADAVIAVMGEKGIAGGVTDTRISLRKSRGSRTGEETRFDLRVVTVDAISGETSCVIDWQARATPAGTTAGQDGQGDGKGKRKRWPKGLYPFRVAMHNALAEHGKHMQPFGVEGPTVLAVESTFVRVEFLKSYPAAGDNPVAAKRAAYSRALRDIHAATTLVQSREIEAKDYFWFVEADER